MSRLSRSRAVVATGLTLGTATAGLLFAPAAFAAETTIVDEVSTGSVTGPSTVVAGESFSLDGTACRYLTGGDAGLDPAVLIATDSESDKPEEVLFDAEADPETGKWTAEVFFPAGTPAGTHTIEVSCLKSYNGSTVVRSEEYEPFQLTVTAPAAAPTSGNTAGSTSGSTSGTATQASASASASTTFVPGAKPNTPGIANSKTSTTTGNAAAPGQKVVKVLKGFKPFEKVKLVLHSTPVELGEFTADANGVLTAEFTVPAGTPLGQHTLAYDGNMGSHFEDPLTLTAGGKALAYTGASVGLPLVGGSVLLAAGAGALVIGRRRRTAGATQV